MRKLFLLLTSIGVAGIATAQQVRPASAPRIYHELQQLKHLTNVLYLAAHPDDENTRLLAWLVNDRNIRTGYLSLTRGDGGQNILGTEQGQALGLIRTHELMEARKIDGAEQFFTRAVDFGFSKNYQETFKHWNEYMLTADVTWVMRKFRPDVVICRFPPNTDAGHGQHAASAILAAKAFKAAGDNTQYTEQLHYYPTWHPKRLLFNSFRFGDHNTTSESQFKIGVGQYIPSIGMGSGELAGLSRSVHKSQGAGTPSVPGIQTEYFKLVDGDTLSNSLFDGIDITWNRVQRPDIGEDLQAIINDYDERHPDASIPALLALRKKIATVNDEYWRKEKLGEINQLILDCSGFMGELYARQAQAIKGATLPFTLHVIARSKTPVKLQSINWLGQDTTMDLQISGDTLLSFDHKIMIPENTAITQPYWLSDPILEKDIYTVPNDSLLGMPETPNNLNGAVTLKIGGETFTVPLPLSFKRLDPVKGDVVEQLRIVPDVTLEFLSTLLVTEPDGSVDADIRIHPNKDIDNSTVIITSDNGTVKAINNISLHALSDTMVSVHFTPQETEHMSKGDFYLSAAIAGKDKSYMLTQHVIQYNHIPTLQYFTAPYSKVLRSNWRCTAKRVGYIEGAGDLIPGILRQAGIQVDILKEKDLTDANKLKKYDAIVTGIRAVNVEKKMNYWLPVLLKYAENGGTLIMQYNTLQDLSTTKLGPYPFSLSDKRVTEEDAKITFVNPNQRLLNYPNKITDADFNDWVQERGLYFASKWDSKYEPLFRMSDSGEDALEGGTLYAKTGKGNYIYTSLSFSRQLPSGNKGAIRLFMNMLSVGK